MLRKTMLLAALLVLLPGMGDAQTPGINYYPGVTSKVLAAAVPAVATSGTSEEVLYTYSLPGGMIGKDGDTLQLLFTGQTAANGNTKTARFRIGGIGGASVCGISAASNNQAISCLAFCQRTSSSTMSCWTAGFLAASIQGSSSTVTGQNFAAATSIVVTGTTTTAAGDLTINSVMISKLGL